ncbi:MAG: hypothetical protein AAF235_08565, partial [Planctomycetota bacterium]
MVDQGGATTKGPGRESPPDGAEASFGSAVGTSRGGNGAAQRYRWIKGLALTGAAISILVHAIVALIAAVVVLRFSGGGGEGATETVDFAVITSAELAAEVSRSQSSDGSLAPELADSASAELDELELDADALLDSLSERSLDADLSMGGGDLSDGELMPGLGGGEGGGTSFFGVEAQGSRIAYVVDVSSSMRSNGRIARTKTELLRSLDGLAGIYEFLIVLYSDGFAPLGGSLAWTQATERNKGIFERRIRSMGTGGGTKPLPAFQAVLGLRTKPDAVFFMTDGEIPDEVPNAVRALNRRHSIPIHCILVGDVSESAVLRDEARRKLQQIARQSGG